VTSIDYGYDRYGETTSAVSTGTAAWDYATGSPGG
jgi:hypothetical protein